MLATYAPSESCFVEHLVRLNAVALRTTCFTLQVDVRQCTAAFARGKLPAFRDFLCLLCFSARSV